MKTASRRSSLAVTLMGMLLEEPMHAYRMQKLIRERGKHKVVNVRQKTSVYQTLERLLRLGLIEIRDTVQTGDHPDRTVYAISNLGRDTTKAWLREMLVTVGEEFPEFPAALATLTVLRADDARKQLGMRSDAVRKELNKLDAARRKTGDLPRLFLLEDEYRAALLKAELVWIQSVIAELRDGSLVWNKQWLKDIAAKFSPNDEDLP